MAQVFKRVNGRKLTKIIATGDGVQNYLEEITFEMAVRAEQSLIDHRQDGHSQIDVEHGDVDWYVVLDDERGQDAALSIEFGRAGYIDPSDGLVRSAMEPLYILTDATNLPRRKKRMPSLKPYDDGGFKPSKKRRKKKGR
jgi:hypothetical protein